VKHEGERKKPSIEKIKLMDFLLIALGGKEEDIKLIRYP
jgi:hypothetical protein